MRELTSIRILPLALALSLAAGAGIAQDRANRLFELEAGDLPAFRGAEAAWRVRVDTELLATAPGLLLLETPDGLEYEARRMSVERRGLRSLTWRGRLSDSRSSRAILALEEGVLSGWIHTPYGDYEVRPLADGGSAVLRLSNDPLGGCKADYAPREAPNETARAPSGDDPPASASDSASSIDVLMLFTHEARDAMGGLPLIKSRVRLMVDLANDAFANSRMDARLKIAHLGLSPFRELGDMGDNLDAFRVHPQVRALRDAHSADLVALVQSTDADSCGIAYVMDELGTGFSPWAYSVTAYSCITTLGHEIGHNMGMHHDPANAPPAEEAIFPWAFGHYVMNDFRTMMSYPSPCGSCTRIPYFSSPNVFREGQATGLAGERDNARVGNRTAVEIANYRLSGVVLTDDFEGGAPAGWQRNKGNLQVLQPGLEGDYALDIPMTGLPNRRFLMHRIAGAGTGVDIEFLFNANAVELDGAEVDLLALLGKGQPHTKLVLVQQGASRKVKLLTRGSTGDYVEVGSTVVRATKTESLRLEWRAASVPGMADGLVRLLKNGRARGVLRDFANDHWIVREVRLGLPYGAEGTSGFGRVYVDDYSASVPLELEQ